MSRVVAAIDNSAAARPVLTTARAISVVLGGATEAVHVLENGDETARAMADSAGVELRTLSGDPAEALADVVSEEDVLALVLGTHGRLSGRRRAGHLALDIAGRTDKPVVAVPPETRPPERLQKVLVAMEGSPGKRRALLRSIALSTSAGLEIVIVHVDEEIPSFNDQVQYESETYAHEFFARHLIGAPEVTLELRIGVPAEEVLAAAESTGVDLIAVGWPHTTDPSRGAVAREILDRSPVPVLLVAIV